MLPHIFLDTIPADSLGYSANILQIYLLIAANIPQPFENCLSSQLSHQILYEGTTLGFVGIMQQRYGYFSMSAKLLITSVTELV
jgi:hypothetical protein